LSKRYKGYQVSNKNYASASTYILRLQSKREVTKKCVRTKKEKEEDDDKEYKDKSNTTKGLLI
jgi:hypothetical protein